MDVKKVIANSNIRPTDRKIKQAQRIAKDILPKEMPIERPVYIATPRDVFEHVKDSIQVAVENMRNH